jgi:hypothetical protein
MKIEPKEKAINGDEVDVLDARHLLCVFCKPGVARKSKRRINRRWRRRLKLEDKDEIDIV